MKSIIGYIRAHLQTDFKPLYYLAVFGFIALCIWNNYATAPSGYRSWEYWIIRHYYLDHSLLCFFIYLFFYGIPYLVIALITAFFNDDARFFGKKEFWVRSFFIIGLISLQASLSIHRWIGAQVSFPPDKYYLMRMSAPLMPFIVIGIPVLLFWWRSDRKRGVPFMYGLTRKGFDPLPYLMLLGLIFPIIFWASAQKQFLNFYPTLQLRQIMQLSYIENEKVAFFLYEIIYGLYFIWAEVIFRGFLVVGMKDTMGRHAIAPMTGLYTFMHFAKPPGETISSIFGGYLLGIIAFRTDNIVGGAIIHGCIAVMMDVLAFWWLS